MPKDPNQDGEKDLVELLQEYYHASKISETDSSYEMQDFDSFFDDIESKIEAASPSHKLAKINEQISQDYAAREKSLKKSLDAITCEPDFKKFKDRDFDQIDLPNANKKSTGSRKVAIIIFLAIATIIALSLAAFAKINFDNLYNFVSTKQIKIWGKLELTEKQKTAINKLESELAEFQELQERKRNKLEEQIKAELKQEVPNLDKVDRHHTALLKLDIISQRFEAENSLKKRYILNEEQTLKLLRD